MLENVSTSLNVTSPPRPVTVRAGLESSVFSQHHILLILNDQLFHSNSAAFCFLSVMILTGLVGNGFVVYVYSCRFKMTSSNMFILCLACCDLVSCCIGLTNELIGTRYPLVSDSVLVCKLLRGSSAVFNYVSALTLPCIAFDVALV